MKVVFAARGLPVDAWPRGAAARVGPRPRRHRRGLRGARSAIRSSSSRRTSARASASRRPPTTQALARAIDLAVRIRSQGARRAGGARRPARSSAPCSATTTRRRRCPARSCPTASSTTTRPSTSTTGSEIIIPAALTPSSRTRSAAWRSRRSAPSTAPGMARVDFLLSRRDRAALRQRGEHDPRLHHDQHVREAVGGHRPRLPRAARSPHQAGARAARRQAAAAHERGVTTRRPGLVLAVAVAALARAPPARRPAPLTESARLAARLRR